jgi:EAL domain-containing protein (putative c-di-GMP-specific phosphodiesterase class I)
MPSSSPERQMTQLTAYEAGAPRPLRVFLCHPSDDRPTVRQLYQRLRAAGLEAWLDEANLVSGQHRDYEITKALCSADVVIVCLSRGSVKRSGDVPAGMKFALDLADEQPEGTIFLLPLKLEECEIPERLHRWQWINYFAKDGYLQLMRALVRRAETLHLGVDHRRGLLEPALQRAIECQEFLTRYQPIVSLDDLRLLGFEALVRWQDPERGLIPPTDFIAVAEETGQILTIDHSTLTEACRQMRRWQMRFRFDPPLFISVNLSSRQFDQPRLVERIKESLEEAGLAPGSLKLEAAESAVMGKIDAASDQLGQLRMLGVGLCLDDFGSAYSSLTYLRQLPISMLKMDRSLISDMVEDDEKTETVRTIVLLARTLGMDVVAKGIETKEQAVLLKRLGCRFGQGYYFAGPMAADIAEQLIYESHRTPQ